MRATRTATKRGGRSLTRLDRTAPQVSETQISARLRGTSSKLAMPLFTGSASNTTPAGPVSSGMAQSGAFTPGPRAASLGPSPLRVMLDADGSRAGKASPCPLRFRRSRRCRRCCAVSLRCRDSIEVLAEISTSSMRSSSARISRGSRAAPGSATGAAASTSSSTRSGGSARRSTRKPCRSGRASWAVRR
jgi:hypothetical protein